MRDCDGFEDVVVTDQHKMQQAVAESLRLVAIEIDRNHYIVDKAEINQLDGVRRGDRKVYQYTIRFAVDEEIGYATT